MEDRRVFVREAAAQLANASNATLHPDTAAGVAEICHTVMTRAEAAGATVIARFAGQCKELCNWVLQGTSPGMVAEADALLKTSLAAIRSALFNMALGDSEDASPGQFERLHDRIREMISAPSFDLLKQNADEESGTQAGGVVPPPAPEFESLGSVTNASLAPSAGEQSPAEKLLKSVARLAHEIHNDVQYRDLAFDVANAVRTVHSVRFEKVCQGTETDTPDALLEVGQVRAVREQLTRWTEEGWSSSAVASLRQVGGVLWLELRQIDSGPSEKKSAKKAEPVSGIGFTESYYTGEQWVRRARLDLLLPAFQAYEVRTAMRTFLVPVGDVHGVVDGGAPEGLEAIPMWRLLDIEDGAEDSEATLEPRAAIVVAWRGQTSVVSVDSIQGPETYYGYNVEDAGPDERGIVGVAHLADGDRAPVLDLYPWLETFHERVEAQRANEERQKSLFASGQYSIFKVAGRRYAVPMTAVRGVGRIDGRSLLTGTVETKRGVYHLYDAKELLDLEGECGSVYLVIASRHGTIAWAIDAVEKVAEPVLDEDRFQLAKRQGPFGRSRRMSRLPGLIRGILPLAEPFNASPVYLLDVDRLIPPGRPYRRPHGHKAA